MISQQRASMQLFPTLYFSCCKIHWNQLEKTAGCRWTSFFLLSQIIWKYIKINHVNVELATLFPTISKWVNGRGNTRFQRKILVSRSHKIGDGTQLYSVFLRPLKFGHRSNSFNAYSDFTYHQFLFMDNKTQLILLT